MIKNQPHLTPQFYEHPSVNTRLFFWPDWLPSRYNPGIPETYVARILISWSPVVSEMWRTHVSCVFLRIYHVCTCRVHFNAVVSVQHSPKLVYVTKHVHVKHISDMSMHPYFLGSICARPRANEHNLHTQLEGFLHFHKTYCKFCLP